MSHRNHLQCSISPRLKPLSLALRQILGSHATAARAGGLVTAGMLGLAAPLFALELSDLDGTSGFVFRVIENSPNL
jgi:hypothetical protein